MALIDLTGQRFGKLLVKEYIYSKNKKKYWRCLCDCGKESIVSTSNLRKKKRGITSCGCSRMIDITGQRFERLVVEGPSHQQEGGTWHWKCICDCGNTLTVNGTCLRNGNTKSCGCLMKELMSKRFRKNGVSRTRIGNIHHGIMRRCYNPKDKDYPHYGGRGIEVCIDWHDIVTFYKWAEEHYTAGLTIERINNDGNYCPENCKWIPREEQAKNRSNNHPITFNGETKLVKDWADLLEMKPYIIYNRLRKNWTIEEALTTPVGVSRKKEKVNG